jgi:hypothetical protein
MTVNMDVPTIVAVGLGMSHIGVLYYNITDVYQHVKPAAAEPD